MTLLTPRYYLLCYDVANAKRLGRLYRFLLGHGIPVQYSVFLLHKTPRDVQCLASRVLEIIDERADDVRAYPLPDRPRLFRFGEDMLPEDVRLFDAKGGEVWK